MNGALLYTGYLRSYLFLWGTCLLPPQDIPLVQAYSYFC